MQTGCEDKGRLLVIDDNPLLARLLEKDLQEAGYDVAVAATGKEALEILRLGPVDLVLLDVELPDVSGLELCRRIKEDPRTAAIPVLFVTGRTAKEDIIAGFDAGGQDYITKPYLREELLARVHTHLALKRTQERLRASEARYREMALRDDLTGFYNTRYLYLRLQQQLDEIRRHGGCLTLLFLDIDDFKQVVDRYGHLVGSRVIAELAGLIRELLPPDGYGVSYGGDEFVLVLPGRDRREGGEIAERIRAAVADHTFLRAQGLNIRITLSCGLASAPEDTASLTGLLGRADHALFTVKKMGKNAVGEMRIPELLAS